MSNITIDLTKVVELAMPQVRESVDSLLLQAWLDGNSGAEGLAFDAYYGLLPVTSHI